MRRALVGSLTLLFALAAGAQDLAAKQAPFTWGDAARPADLRGATSWADLGAGGVRGMTIGPIESLRYPGKGYGSAAYGRALDEVVEMGATWVSLTPFGRTWDLKPTGVDLVFEAPFEENREDVRRAIRMAKARGLRVLLVPHLWVESQQWRAEIDPGDDAAWERWARSYERFLLTWAEVAADAGADMLSVGVELRSWVTTARARLFFPILERVRQVFPGLLTYSANWDDVDDTAILQAIDVIGINAFYPLTHKKDASDEELLSGGYAIADKLAVLSATQKKPVLLTEIGYKTIESPAVEPWIWPEALSKVVLSERDQAAATRALIAPLLDKPFFVGFFVWRVFADPDDVSQEPPFGFSPRGKLAEVVLRDAFASVWAADGAFAGHTRVGRLASSRAGLFSTLLAGERVDE